jgi:hypothetical protein
VLSLLTNSCQAGLPPSDLKPSPLIVSSTDPALRAFPYGSCADRLTAFALSCSLGQRFHFIIWTAESLHYGWTLSMQELIVSI